MEENEALFESSTAAMTWLVQEKRGGTLIRRDLITPIVEKIENLSAQVSPIQRHTSGAAILVSAKLLLPTVSTLEKLELIRIYEKAIQLIEKFENLPNLKWANLEPLFLQYVDFIPADNPGAKKYLEFIIFIFDKMKESASVNSEFFYYANILTISRVTQVSLHLIQTSSRDVEVRKLAFEILSRVVRQCPKKNAPTVQLIISGILGGLVKIARALFTGADFMDNTIRLFADSVILVFADSAIKFDKKKVDFSKIPEKIHFIFKNQTDAWNEDAKKIINEYIRLLLEKYLGNRLCGVKRRVIQMILEIQTKCRKFFGNTLYGSLLDIYKCVKHDPLYQELAANCFSLVKDRKMIETYFYQQLDSSIRTLPIQTRSSNGLPEFRALCAVLEGLGSSISLMCKTGSDTLERLIESIVDSVIIDKKGLMITESEESEIIEEELQKFKLQFNLDHEPVQHLCNVLADAAGLEIIDIILAQMRGASAQKRSSYYILLAYILVRLEMKLFKPSKDDPIIRLLAEHLVHQTNKSFVINAKKDSRPTTGPGFEHDWETCLEALSCLNLALCMQFIESVEAKADISIKCLCTILCQTSSETWIVSETAETALRILAQATSKGSKEACDVVDAYSSHILNSASIACSSSKNYHMAPILLKSYLKYVSIHNDFDQVKVIVEKLLYALDNNEQRYTISILQSLYAFLEALAEDDEDPEDSEDSDDDGDEEKEDQPTDQQLLAHSIFLRTKNLLSSKHVRVRITTLEILIDGLKILADFEKLLLPIIYQNFRGIMSIVKEKKLMSLEYAIEAIAEMTLLSGDFMRDKVLKQFWPEISPFLYSTIAKQTFEHTAEHRVVVRLLSKIPDFVKNLELNREETDEVFIKILDFAISENSKFAYISQKRKNEIIQFFEEN